MAKVHELAKELGLTSKELLEIIDNLGIEVKSHMSKLSEEEEKRVREAVSAEGNKPAKTQKSKKETKGDAASGEAEAPSIASIPGAPPFAADIAGAPPFAGAIKPIINDDYFEKKKKQEEAEAQTEEAVETPEVETTEEAKVEEKPEPKEEAVAVVDDTEKKEDAAAPKEDEGTKAEEPKAKAEVKVEPEKKETIDKPKRDEGQKLKIIRRAEDEPVREKKPQKRQAASDDRRDDRRDGRGDRKRDRQQDAGRGPKRQRENVRFEPKEEPALPKAQDRRQRGGDSSRRDASGSGRQEGKRGGKKYDDRQSKFEKLERKSLEKQTKGKHAKYKTAEPVQEVEEVVLPEGTVVLTVPITVAGFCEQTEVSTSKVIMTLMKLGIMANINQNIDEDTVMILAEELGITVHIGKVQEVEEEEGLELFEDKDSDLVERPPIITVMGHVDHGKTSLLDAIRKTNVTASESGGITQHIGASEVSVNGQRIVFLDTPGHEAFTAMRARGAHVTDIAVLVVAADDGVMPQTIESISHAKAAGVPIIVAVNKMDKPGANPNRVKQELSEHGVLVEDWGGDVISVPVSAKTGEGIVNLLEMILLQAEVLELKANPNRLAMGSVIEARLDKSKGPVATLLVTNGTLESGQSIVAGTCAGRIRLMTDDKGRTITKAGPATAVEILGLTEVPQAGDEFNAVKEDRIAREIAEKRSDKLREEVLARNASMSLEKLFSQIQEGEVKELNLIIKGDVQGSIGALVSSLEKLNNDQVKVNIIHTGVGTVTESDVMLAGTSGAVIIGFNVRPSTAVQTMADRDDIEIRTYRVIYDVIDDVEAAMKGMLDPEFKEEILGKVEIRNTFKVPNVGIVGGAYVIEGHVERNAQVRLVRDGIVIHEGTISSLKRFKDDAKEVAQGYECGIGIENYNDIKEGDVIECFHMVEVKRD